MAPNEAQPPPEGFGVPRGPRRKARRENKKRKLTHHENTKFGKHERREQNVRKDIVADVTTARRKDLVLLPVTCIQRPAT
jgi:hypothetical protein